MPEFIENLLSVISSYHFRLDNNGNRTYIDKREPLVSIMDQVQFGYIYNNRRNRLVSADNVKLDYDFEGRLTKKGQTVYKFDYEHRLISGAGKYFYDGAGNRLQAVRNGVVTRYIYDAAGNLLAEADGSNKITRYYIYGHGLLAMVTPGDDIYCYHFNAAGSTIAMTDKNQNMVNRYAYTPFGIIANQAETVPQPFKYIGQYGVMSEPDGLYYMRARYYDSQSGRFISEDPMGFDGGDVNLYAYVNNNPIMFIDPTGLEASGFIVGAISGGMLGALSGFEEGDIYGAVGGLIVGSITGGAVGLALDPISGGKIGGVVGAVSGNLAGAIIGEMLGPRSLTPSERDPIRIKRFPVPKQPSVYYGHIPSHQSLNNNCSGN